MADTLGVVVGRFQVDELTEGHKSVIDHVNAVNDRTLILVGIVPSPATATNPLPFESVRDVINEHIDNMSDVDILPIMDCPTNEEWSQNLDTIIGLVRLPGEKVNLYCSRDGFKAHYKGKYEVTELAEVEHVSGTDVRTDIGQYRVMNVDWRRGVIWAMENLHTRTYHTVDAALFRYGKDGYLEVLMGKKPHNSFLRFPGGFVEPTESFTEAAGRELLEETQTYSLNGFRIVKDFVIDDWRVRGKKGVTHKTVLCAGWWDGFTKAKASDDLQDVEWIDIDTISVDLNFVVKEHRILAAELIKYLREHNIATYKKELDTTGIPR